MPEDVHVESIQGVALWDCRQLQRASACAESYDAAARMMKARAGQGVHGG